MTQPRLPAIGDSVRRYDDKGAVVFDGYVYADDDEAGGQVYVVPADAPSIPSLIEFMTQIAERVADGGDPSDAVESVRASLHREIVSTLDLVRGLHGWRWAPFDGRPQVGDILVKWLPSGFAPRRFLMTGETTMEEIGPDGTMAGPGSDQSLLPAQRARAIAGLDGWSWEPARWSAPAPKGTP